MPEGVNASDSRANVLYDTPLTNPQADRLGRKDFAENLAKAILQMNVNDGFVFALNGSWGSGKTSLINFVVHFLVQHSPDPTKLILVRFSPWWFSGSEQILHQFFRQMRVALGARDRPKTIRKVGSALADLGSLLEPLAPVLGGTPLGTLFKGLGAILARRGDIDLQTLRASIDDMLRRQDSRIVVVIDDIDRLTAKEIREVFQVVKAVADFPKTVYLLSFDRAVVVDALNTVQGGTGEGYLEKIVQASFDLPSPDNTSLNAMLFANLNEILVDTPDPLWDRQQWGNIYFGGIVSFIRTPRDVKRFVNILRPTYAVVKGEVNGIDFLGVQALRLFVPRLYDFIVENKELLTGAQSHDPRSLDRGEHLKPMFDAALAQVPAGKREAANDIMTRLFPKWASAYGGGLHGSDWLSEWHLKRRVCSPDVFDLYHRLSLPPGEVGAVEMQSILVVSDEPNTFAQVLLRLAAERRHDGISRLRVFLEHFRYWIDRDIPPERIEPILQAIYSIGDRLYIEGDEQGMFSFGNDMLIMSITRQLLEKLLSQEARFEMISRVFLHAEAVSLVVMRVAILAQEHGEHSTDGPRKPEDARLVAAHHLPPLKRIALDRVRWADEVGLLPDAPGLGSILFRVADWQSEEDAKRYAEGIATSDEGFAAYVAAFLWKSHSAGLTDRVSQMTWRVNVKNVTHFVDSDESTILERCRRILSEAPPWLSGQKKLAMEALIREVTEPEEEM